MTIPAPAPRPTPTDPRVDGILDIVAREAKVDRARLALDAPIEALGITSLDVTLVLFEIEKQFGIEIPAVPETAGPGPLTVGALVGQLLELIDHAAAPVATIAAAPPNATGSH
jgi:acyl carrier protein